MSYSQFTTKLEELTQEDSTEDTSVTSERTRPPTAKPRRHQRSPSIHTSPLHDSLTRLNENVESPSEQHVFAEVHVSPQPSPASRSNDTETIIEMQELEERLPLPKLAPLIKKHAKKIEKISKQIKSENKKKNKMKKLENSSNIVSTPDNFFASTWSRDEPVTPQGQSESPILDLSPDHARFTLEEYFGPNKAQLTEYVDREKIPSNNCDNIFYSSSKPVSVEAKLGPGVVPRFREEEGIYVGTKPEIPWSVRNKMEQRIIINQNSCKEWFGEDGEIVSVEDAIRHTPMRPLISEDVQDDNSIFSTFYKEAEVCDGVASTSPLLIELALGKLKFSHHPLFSGEHVIAQQLAELHRVYAEREAMGKTDRLAGRLTALRHAKDLMLQRGNTGDRLDRCCGEIKEIRLSLLTEGAHDRSLLAALLSTWKQLRSQRSTQGYTSCPLRLVISQHETDEQHETQQWQREVDTMVQEMLQEQGRENEERGELEIQSLASKLLSEGRRPPGEPLVRLELRNDVSTDSTTKDSKERQRRALLRRYHVHLVICYNGQEVCRTQSMSLQEQFEVDVDFAAPLSVSQWPQNISVQIREESSAVTSSLLALVTLPLPNRGITISSSSVECVEFSSIIPMDCIHGACAMHPAGTITSRLGWGKDKLGNILEPPDKFWSAWQRRKPVISVNKSPGHLKLWADKAKLDPNDPNNASVFNAIKGGLNSDLEYVDDIFLPKDDDDWIDSVRLRVLQLRMRGEPEFCTLKMVPANERELPPGVIKDYEARHSGTRETELETYPESSLSAQRVWGRRSMRRIRDLVQQQSRLASRRRTLRDLVTEDLVPDIGTLGVTFMQWLQPSRPLRPLRKPRKQVASLPGVANDAMLIVNIVSAFQVPIRRELDLGATRTSLGSSGVSPVFSTVAVRPYMEVTFQGDTSRTLAADGANPTWNQELQIPIKTSCSSRERISLTLFDEVTLDVLEDERLRGVDTHTRMERAWLGNISFPFSALLLTSRIDGTFPLVSPPLLGYEREAQLRQFSTMDSPPTPVRSEENATFVTLFITVQPALHPPEPPQDRLESSESAEMEQHLEMWEVEVASNFPERKVRALVPDSQGKAVCMTRFFKPLPPPDCGDEGKSGRLPADLAARFVSLIPASDPGSGTDVWLPADQLLTLCTGDLMPRAALLTCFLQHLGLRAWLMIGWGLNSGSGGFVLSRGCGQAGQEDDLWVWEVHSGRRTTLDDPFCPVTMVWALVNQENIWGNIQRDANPRRMRFNVARLSDWLPTFPPGGVMIAPDLVTCVQPDALRYCATSEETCQDLADKLERTLRDAFISWRPSLRTRWNRHCSAVLRRVLPSFEHCLGRPEAIRELQPLLAAHKMVGFPLQMCYSDEASVIRSLHATQLHMSRDNEVEFSIAVHVHPMPSSVVSVWVYAASLQRRR